MYLSLHFFMNKSSHPLLVLSFETLNCVLKHVIPLRDSLLRNAYIYSVCCSGYRYECDCKKDVYVWV
jgi:hypothetical protein